MEGFDKAIEFYGDDTNIARQASKFGNVKFSLSFVMPTSARRFSEETTLKTAAIYILNFISIVILHKPATKIYKDIR